MSDVPFQIKDESGMISRYLDKSMTGLRKYGYSFGLPIIPALKNLQKEGPGDYV